MPVIIRFVANVEMNIWNTPIVPNTKFHPFYVNPISGNNWPCAAKTAIKPYALVVQHRGMQGMDSYL